MDGTNPELIARLLRQYEKKKQYQRGYRLRNKEYYARKQRERREKIKERIKEEKGNLLNPGLGESSPIRSTA